MVKCPKCNNEIDHLIHYQTCLVSWIFELDKDSMAISKVSFGGFKEYYALIYPLFREEGFVLVMALTRMKKIFKHIMSIKAKEETIVEDKRKTVKTLTLDI